MNGLCIDHSLPQLSSKAQAYTLALTSTPSHSQVFPIALCNGLDVQCRMWPHAFKHLVLRWMTLLEKVVEHLGGGASLEVEVTGVDLEVS